MDILTGENLSSIYVANIELIYWPIRSYSKKKRGRGKGSVISLFYPAGSIIILEYMKI